MEQQITTVAETKNFAYNSEVDTNGKSTEKGSHLRAHHHLNPRISGLHVHRHLQYRDRVVLLHLRGPECHTPQTLPLHPC